MAETTKLEGVYTIRLENGPALRELEKLNKQLFNVRAEKTGLAKTTRQLIAEEKSLEKEIKASGVASDAQAKKLADVRRRRDEANRALTEAIAVERGLSSQTRELNNDLSGLTATGQRFRDKMSDAFTKALEGSNVFQQLGTRAEFLETKLKEGASAMEAQQQQIAELNAQLQSGAKTEEQYAEEMRVLNEEIAKGKAGNEALQQELAGVTEKSAKLTAEVDALNKELREGKISQDEYRAGIAKIEEETRKAGVETANLTSRFDDFAKNQGRELKSSLSSLALQYVGVGAAISGLTNLVGDSVATIRAFEQSNANLASILGVSRSEIGKLTQSALELGPALGRLPSEVTDLQTELAKLGFTEGQILDAQEAVILLANATGEGLAPSAETAAGTLKALGLGAEDTQRLVDVMAESFNKTSLDLSKFTTASSTIAPVARAAGVELEQMTAQIGILSDANIDASTTGTSLRDIYIDLADKGITMDDALQQINASTDKLSTANELFGKRSATVALVLAENVAKTDELTTSFENAGGAAEKMANEQLNTLDGDLKKLSATWDAAVISGNFFSDTLRKSTQGLTGDLKALGEATNVFELVGALGSTVQSQMLQARAGLRDALQDPENALKALKNQAASVAKALADAQLSGNEQVEAIASRRLDAIRRQIDLLNRKVIAEEQSAQATRAASATEREATAQSETIAEARDRIAASIETEKAALEELATTDAEGLAAGKQRIVALEKELAALEGKTSVSKAAAAQEKKDLADLARLNDELTQARIESEQASLKPRQREEAQVTQVRDDRVARAQGDADTLQAIEAQYQADLQEIREKYAKQDAELMANSEAELRASLQRRNEQELAALDARQTAELQQIERDGGDVHAALVRQQEERVALVLESRRVQEEILTEQFNTDFAALDGQLIAQLDRQTQYEADLALMRAEFRASDLQAQVESSQAQLNAEQQLQDARISAIGGFANALGGLAEENSDLAKAFFLVEKAAAAADVIMKTQREIAGYYLAYSAIPGGPAIAGSLALAARIRSATSLAQIIATSVQGFDAGGDISGDVRSNWGTRVTRPGGDNVLVRAGNGYVTLKTGEKVLNEKQQRELERRTHTGIWGDIGLPGYRNAQRDFRMHQVQTAFADGGVIGLVTPRPSPSTIVSNQLVNSLDTYAERPIYTLISEVNDVQSRVQMQETARTL